MRKFLLLFPLLLLTIGLFGQRTVTGKVADQAGEPLIGANVFVKGSTVGTVTDFDGNYTIVVPEGSTVLIVSYTGYDSKEIILGTSNVVDVGLVEGQMIEEVVVTALGIDRNARDVAYANQVVKSDELLSAPNKNTLEALRGKVAGVKISTGSGSVSASTRIVLRGEGSLTGNNNALIVIDGIPIDNSASRSGDPNNRLSNLAQDGYADFGNRFNDLNPADIESITVLKGPSATSLYGSRGASGVLLVTTKKGGGKEGSFHIGLNSSFSAEQVYVLMQRQDQYGQGFGIPFQATYGRDSGENFSWGAPFDGVVRPWTSPVDSDGDGDLEWLSRPYSNVDNQLQNFFDVGNTLSNSVYFSGAQKDFTYYASYSNTEQAGILQNTDYHRNTFKVAASAKLTKRLTSDFSVNYSLVNENTTQEGFRPFEGQNAYANALQSPVNIPLSELRDYHSPFHGFTGYYGSYTANPYFILNENVNNGKINNFLGNAQLKYQLTDHWNASVKFGLNNVTSDIVQASPQYAYNDHYFWGDGLDWTLRGNRAHSDGFYAQANLNNTNLDVTGLTDYNLKLSESLTADFSVGYNFFQRKTARLDGQTVGGIVVPGFYNLSNSVQAPLANDTRTNYRIMGALGNVRLGWDQQLFLEYSARNDWSSTLPEENNSFFYQAVGVSAILTDILNMEGNTINFLKLRASYGTTGKDADIYLLNSVYVANPTLQSLANNHDLFFPLNGQAGFTQGNRIGNPGLMPELTTTFEVGVDASFFNDRVGLEYTYYDSKHTNQIVVVTLPNSTGYTSTVKNLGEMQNSGHEVSLTLRPFVSLDGRGFTWDITLLYAQNRNEVIKINPEGDQTELTIDNFYGVNEVAAVGLPYGTFKGQVVKTNEAGQIVVDATGLPLLSDDLEYLGSYQPDWTGSISNTFGWRGFSFDFLFDIREGGSFLSPSKDMVEFNGTAKSTLIGDRGYFVVPNSVIENSDGSYSTNTKEVAPYDYIRNQPFTTHLIDASYVKLREVSLKYQFPKSLVSKTPLASATIGIFAKNLKFWLPDENQYADPEINGPGLTGNATGVETAQTPPSHSYGATLSLIF